MSGFSSDWLALREPADIAARNADLRKACTAFLEGRARVTLLDLGCGTGSNLRALSPHLGAHQVWHLVDYDAGLLNAARMALTAFADKAETQGEALILRKGAQTIEVHFRQVDLSTGLDALFELKPDMVSAAAFFDLVSPSWIAQFADTLARARLPLYTVLTYDGLECWTPAHEADAAMLKAFCTHQMTDKGFGASAGPQAAGLLTQALLARGYACSTGMSPWQLDGAHAALRNELAKGSAAAVAETGKVAPEAIASWLKARLAPAVTCEIGHIDLFALPN